MTHHLFNTAGIWLVLSAPLAAQDVNTGYFGNVAIRGYDPVAYFTMARAVLGKAEISHEWLGAVWQFSDEKHLELFRENPISYAPQYGGNCADAVAYNTFTTNIDPNAWRIIDGKLYLNFDQGAAEEIEEIPGQLERAEANWPGVRDRMRKATVAD